MTNYIRTNVKIYVDGKEVENLSVMDAPIIATDEAQSGEVVKLYDSFSGTIKLTRKQSKRLFRIFQKAEKKQRRKEFFERIKSIFKGGF